MTDFDLVKNYRFTYSRVKLLESQIDDGEFLWRNLKVPFLELAPPAFNPGSLIQEARNLKSRFVDHRESDSRGWKSLCLHGLAENKTRSVDFYGYAREEEAPYTWTQAAQDCPQTTAWLKQLLEQGWFTKFYRVRFMWLEPHGYIEYHQDRPHFEKRLGPLNIALNMPPQCYWVFKEWGAVPFRDGSALALDVSNQHGVWNRSSEDRIHIIIHGSYGPEYFRQISQSAKRVLSQKPVDPPLLPTNPPVISFGIWFKQIDGVSIDFLQKCQRVTEHFARIGSHIPFEVVKNYSLNNLLDAAARQKAEYGVIFSPGHIPSGDFLGHLLSFLHSPTAKNYLQPNSDDFMIVHIPTWLNLGRPTPEQMRKNPKVFQVENLPTSFSEVLYQLDINSHTVNEIEENLEGYKQDRYGGKDIEPSMTSHERAISYLSCELQGWKNKIFVFNTEGYNDIRNTHTAQPYDAIYSLASGFKDLYFLKELKVYDHAPIIYYDISEKALLLKKYTYEHWDGKDYPQFLRTLLESHDRFPGLEDAIYAMNWADLDKLWKQELAQWPSEKVFEETFLNAKNRPKEFIHIDIIKNPELLLKKMSSAQQTQILLWYSNCFGYTPSIAELDWQTESMALRGASFLNAIKEMALAQKKSITLFGEDVWYGSKLQVRGQTPQEILT